MFLQKDYVMPQVSVIIPTHKRPFFLPRAISSVLAQTYQDWEMIVVDDASNDETGAIVKSFSDPRIQYLYHEVAKGGSAARNTGILKGQGKFLAFLDDDDEWFPHKLQCQVDLLERSPSKVGVVFAGCKKIEQSSGSVLGTHIPTMKGDLSKELLLHNSVGSTSSVLLKRECLQQVGLFDETLPSGQDYDLWIRISKAWHFTCVSEILFHYYIHEGQITNNPEAISRGVELLFHKLDQNKNILKSNNCQRYFYAGMLYCLKGELTQGRKSFVKAIQLRPLQMKLYLVLCLSFFGQAVLRKILDVRNAMVRLPNEH